MFLYRLGNESVQRVASSSLNTSLANLTTTFDSSMFSHITHVWAHPSEPFLLLSDAGRCSVFRVDLLNGTVTRVAGQLECVSEGAIAAMRSWSEARFQSVASAIYVPTYQIYLVADYINQTVFSIPLAQTVVQRKIGRSGTDQNSCSV